MTSTRGTIQTAAERASLLRGLITDITLDPTEFVKLGGKLYAPICDVRCKTNNGELIIIEMQLSKDKQFFQRMQYYWARALEEKVDTKCWPHVYLLAICLNTQSKVQGNKKLYAQTVLPRARSTGQTKRNIVTNEINYEFKQHTSAQINNTKARSLFAYTHLHQRCRRWT